MLVLCSLFCVQHFPPLYLWYPLFFFVPPHRQRCKKLIKKKAMIISFEKKKGFFIWVACRNAYSISACKTKNCTLLEGCGFVLFCNAYVKICYFLFIFNFVKMLLLASQAIYCIVNRVLMLHINTRFHHNWFSHWCLLWDGFIKQHQKIGHKRGEHTKRLNRFDTDKKKKFLIFTP